MHRIRALITPIATPETVPVRTAGGRILHESVHAPMAVPPFTNSAMDGYALNARDLSENPDKSFRVVGSSLAGHPYSGNLAADECIRITTGAALPACADTVVPQEDCRIGDATVQIVEPVSEGANVRQAGNDVKQGSLLLQSGHRLGPFDLAWLSSCGINQVNVRKKARVAFFSTGDELREPGEDLAPGQIYDSNREVIRQLLKAMPVEVSDLGAIADDPSIIERKLGAAAANHDLLLTSGGVSVGTADYMKEVVQKLGRLDLWRLNLKPGKPLAFGHIGECLFLGLPGNPVSTIVTYLLIAQPAILALSGCTRDEPPVLIPATLRGSIRHSPGREEYQRGNLEMTSGGAEVRATGEQASNRLASFSGANCLIRIRKQIGNLEDGATVEVLLFRGLLG